MSVKEVRKEEVGALWIARLLAMPYRLGAAGSAVVFFLLYLLVAELSYAFVIPPRSNAIFWLPSGITFAGFLRARWLPPIWPFWLLAAFLGELFLVSNHGIPPLTAFIWSAANVVLPLTIVLLTRRFVVSPFDFSSLRDVLTFSAIVALSVIPSGIVAGIGSFAGLGSASVASSAISWAASDALGIVLLAPVLLSWTAVTPRPAGSFAEALLLFGALTTSSFAMLLYWKTPSFDQSMLSFLFFFVAWAAIRFGARGTSVALLTIDLILVGATRIGLGPFAIPALRAGDMILNLQILVVNVGLLMLLLAAAIEEQRKARMTAETALKSRDEFLSVASHELRTPLTPLSLQVQMINRLASQGRLTSLSVEKLANLGRISERQLLRLSSLINDLLDVSRIDAGRLTLNLEDVDLRQAVQNVINRFRVESESAHSSITLHGDSQMIGRWDRSRVEQIIAQLLNNALKYGAGQPIDITLQQERGKARLIIRDHGMGIPKQNHALIFDRYERGVSMKQFGGLGLGLFIVGQIVEAHGGSIGVESEVGQGSCFTVELPLGSHNAAGLPIVA